MTPFDIYRQWLADINCIAPEELGLHMAKTSRAITAVEDILDKHGPQTDAGQEAREALEELRTYHRALVILSKGKP